MKITLILVLCLVAVSLSAWIIAVFVFAGEDHSQYDLPRPTAMSVHAESQEHRAAAAGVANGYAQAHATAESLLPLMRAQLDERGAAMPIVSRVEAVEVDGLSAEWVIAPGARADRRLLFLHGGGYVMGSAKSHRRLTDRLSQIAQAAVLAINYRLMPEHSRAAGIEDCRVAYRWLLANGPKGASPADTLILAGDSAGGNLALVTAAWARDESIQAPNAVIALSPPTDATLASPSLLQNIPTDVMQGGSLGPAVKAPRMLSLWISYFINRINPSSPLVSPLLGDLSDLPPTLLQASQAEMFLDDAVRYANKANAQGSVALIQTWPYLLHVWHAFDVPESEQAFIEIEKFLDQHAPRPRQHLN